jgi:hypothetical protein
MKEKREKVEGERCEREYVAGETGTFDIYSYS